MNREILFRGKRIDNGQWALGYYHLDDSGGFDAHYITTKSNLDVQEVDPKTIGQYTGLKDCKARKIYERDIIRHAVGWVGKVHYIEGAFEIEAKHQSWPANYARCGKIEVIGNLDDNPELLGREVVEE